MHAKHCRHCNAKIPENRGWMENYCCEDHRVAFQERQHQETIARLRREEPDQLESEFALHTFEPKRVRIAMLGSTAVESSVPELSPMMPPHGYISRHIPPPVKVQPLVAPPLQQKASVEQSLAALSWVAEPVSAPLEIPNVVEPATIPEAVKLGASVRRPATPAQTVAPPPRNAAIVNLIRSAKDRMSVSDAATPSFEPQSLGVPPPKPEPGTRPAEGPGKSPGNGARVRSVAVSIPSAGPSTTGSEMAAIPAAKTRTVRPAQAPTTGPSAPSFAALGGSQASESGNRAGLLAIGLTIAVAIGVACFLYFSR